MYPPRVSRRQGLKLGLGAAAYVLLGHTEKQIQNSGLVLASEVPQAPAVHKKYDAASFEAEMGTSPLSVDQARIFLPLIISEYAKAKGLSSLDPEEAASNFIIIHGAVEDPELPLQSTLVANVRKEYKDLSLTDKLVAGFASESYTQTGYLDRALKKVVVFLDNTNNPSRLLNERGEPLLPPVAVMGEYQDLMTCSQATPATIFRVISNHEEDHQFKNAGWQELEDSVLRSWNRVKQQIHPEAPVVEYKSARKSNFMMHFFTATGDEYNIRLNEALTELSANSVHIKNGSPYVVMGYGSPHDLLNLKRMLKQAKIDETELDNLSMSSDIVRLLGGLAKAGIGRTDNSEDENLDFVLERFNNGKEISPPMWGSLNHPMKRYYPDVNEVSPYYDLAYRGYNGCI